MDDLIEYIKSYRREELEIYQFYNGTDLLKSPMEFKIIFMDIELDDGKNGMIVADKVKKFCPSCLIVYVSSYESYFVDMVHHESFDFISKLFAKERVHDVIDRG